MSTLIEKLVAIVGKSNVLTAQKDQTKYITDWPGDKSGRARAVVRPANTQEVSKIMALAYHTTTPVVPQSGNTGVAGGSIPDQSGDAIVLSLERMNIIRDISRPAQTIVVEAGCVLETIHTTVEELGLFFPLNFGARGSCMIGGNLATNAGGSNVVRYGNTRDLCLGIEAVMPDGEIMNLLSGLHKNNTGYDLRNLLIGSEGTLGVITAATLKLFPLPKARETCLATVNDISGSLELLNLIQAETGGAVEAFELMPKALFVLLAKHLPHLNQPFTDIPEMSVLIEIAATSDADAKMSESGITPIVQKLENVLADAFESNLVTDAVIASSEAQRSEIWTLRESALEAITAEGERIGFDIALPLDAVHGFVDEMAGTVERILPGARMLPVGHLGDGNLHYTVFPKEDETANLRKHAADIKAAVYGPLSSYGGSFSAEHGIGASKLAEMTAFKDPAALAVMRRVKTALDSRGIMNPGRMLP